MVDLTLLIGHHGRNAVLKEIGVRNGAVALLKQTQTYLNAEFNPSANAASGTSQSNTSLGSGNLGVGG